MVCELLEVSDLEDIEQRLAEQRIAVDGFPKLEDLVVQIADVVEPSLVRNHKNNKHRIWCSKHWKNIVTRLEGWGQQMKQLPVGQFRVLNIMYSDIKQESGGFRYDM